MKTPPNARPGARSVTGSGLTPDAFGTGKVKMGNFAEPDFVTKPRGPKDVSYGNGAMTSASGAYPTGRQGMVPLKTSGE